MTNAEVPRPPGHLLAQSDQAARDAAERDCLLAEVGVARKMNFDAARQIEAAFDWRGNQGDFFQGGHQDRLPFQDRAYQQRELSQRW